MPRLRLSTRWANKVGIRQPGPDWRPRGRVIKITAGVPIALSTLMSLIQAHVAPSSQILSYASSSPASPALHPRRNSHLLGPRRERIYYPIWAS